VSIMMRFLIAGVLLMAGCVVQPPVAALLRVPPETPKQCDDACGAMGMKMSAVVLIASAAGCVCEPAKPAAARIGGVTATAAGALIAQQQQQQAAATQSKPH
jgi:hypothetical protein